MHKFGRTLTLYALLLLTVLASSCGQDSLVGSNSLSTTTTLSNATVQGKWENSDMPVTMNISDSFSSSEASTLSSMGDAWEAATSNTLNFFNFGAQVSNKDFANMDDYLDSEMGVYLNTSWPSSISSFALAITQYYGYRRNVGTSSEYIELVHADIILNDDYFNFSFNGGAGTYDLPSVVLHEMGHFVGLNHSSDVPSVMYPTLASNTQVRSLYSNDINSINANYGLSALKAASNAMLSSAQLSLGQIEGLENTEVPVEGELVRGTIEIRFDGSCNHQQHALSKVTDYQYHLRLWAIKLKKILNHLQ